LLSIFIYILARNKVLLFFAFIRIILIIKKENEANFINFIKIFLDINTLSSINYFDIYLKRGRLI